MATQPAKHWREKRTDDILTRLRSPEVFIDTGGMFSTVAHEAADVIERLRERRDDWRATMVENHDLWRENERLRKVIDALEGEIRETAEASHD